LPKGEIKWQRKKPKRKKQLRRNQPKRKKPKRKKDNAPFDEKGRSHHCDETFFFMLKAKTPAAFQAPLLKQTPLEIIP